MKSARPTKRSLLSLSLLCALLVGIVRTSEIRPPTGLAAPTTLFVTETEFAGLVFIFMVITAGHLRALGGRIGSLSRFFRRGIGLPLALRVMVLLATGVGLYVFLFWATADLLGGYNGYNWSLQNHPLLREVYHASSFLYLGHVDVGTEASSFFGVALAGVVILGMGGGLWNALKDAVSLFAAPIIGVFELCLWYFAPNDMTWHVIDALWAGGVNDGGWRSFDVAGSGAFIFSNWFVLMVCVMLLASRIPMLGIPSKVLAGRFPDFFHPWLRAKNIIRGMRRFLTVLL